MVVLGGEVISYERGVPRANSRFHDQGMISHLNRCDGSKSACWGCLFVEQSRTGCAWLMHFLSPTPSLCLHPQTRNDGTSNLLSTHNQRMLGQLASALANTTGFANTPVHLRTLNDPSTHVRSRTRRYYRGTSHIKKCPSPARASTIGPHAQSYCRVPLGGGFLWTRYPRSQHVCPVSREARTSRSPSQTHTHNYSRTLHTEPLTPVYYRVTCLKSHGPRPGLLSRSIETFASLSCR